MSQREISLTITPIRNVACSPCNAEGEVKEAIWQATGTVGQVNYTHQVCDMHLITTLFASQLDFLSDN